MIGCDIRDMNEFTKATLTNPEVLAINQDPDYNQPYDVSPESDAIPVEGTEQHRSGEHPIYARLLSNGDYAIGMFNLSDQKATRWNMALQLDRIGLPETTGKTLLLHDVWTGEEMLVKGGIFTANIEPHDCRLFRAKVIDRP